LAGYQFIPIGFKEKDGRHICRKSYTIATFVKQIQKGDAFMFLFMTIDFIKPKLRFA
jgi:hypothetical protein